MSIVVANKSKRLIGLVAKTDKVGEELVIVNLKPGYNKVDEEDWEHVKPEKLDFTQRQIDADRIFIVEKEKNAIKKTRKKGKKSKDLEI